MKVKDKDMGIYSLMTAIRRLTRSSLMFQYAIAEKMNLNPSDAECIDFLMEMGPSTAGDLAKVTRLTTGAITSVIDRLEKAGFVKRQSDPNDRRKVIISFIPKKHEIAKRYYAAMAQDVYDLFSGYSQAKLKSIQQHSEALTAVFQKHADEIFHQ
jgi:MarR family transcriptional regulator, organic hydroperoxide resistance regulator